VTINDRGALCRTSWSPHAASSSRRQRGVQRFPWSPVPARESRATTRRRRCGTRTRQRTTTRSSAQWTTPTTRAASSDTTPASSTGHTESVQLEGADADRGLDRTAAAGRRSVGPRHQSVWVQCIDELAAPAD